MVGRALSAVELQAYLHEHIPLSRAMDVAVVAIDAEDVVLRAPLAPNINHRETAFGGSMSALAILAAWSLLHARCRSEGIDARLVIQRNSMEYEQPVEGDFIARARVDELEWQRFTRMLARKGKARIGIASIIEYEGRAAGRFVGDFVALQTHQP
jgi:thioesterase domain-containing protein